MKKLLLLLVCSFGSISCDDGEIEYDKIEDRGEDIYGPGCEYTYPLNWNSDHINTPVECVMKGSLCIDSIVQHCNDDPEDCYKQWDHCFEWYGLCLKETL